MDKCFKCGASGNVMLFDVISEKGIVKVCGKCLSENKFVLVKKPDASVLRELDKKPKPLIPSFQITETNLNKEEIIKKENLKNQNLALKSLADKNFNMKLKTGKKRTDLVHNFHWILMRARRMKKLTQKQLGEKIAEPEAAIKMAEQGIILESSLYLVEKLERFFGIKIQNKKEPVKENVSFDSIYSKNLNISDLRRDYEKPKPYWRNRLFKKQETDFENKEPVKGINSPKKDSPNGSKKTDLTDEEIDELMYGKK